MSSADDWGGLSAFTTANGPDWLRKWHEHHQQELARRLQRQAMALDALTFLADTGGVNTPGFMWLNDGSGVDGLIEAAIKAKQLREYRETVRPADSEEQ